MSIEERSNTEDNTHHRDKRDIHEFRANHVAVESEGARDTTIPMYLLIILQLPHDECTDTDMVSTLFPLFVTTPKIKKGGYLKSGALLLGTPKLSLGPARAAAQVPFDDAILTWCLPLLVLIPRCCQQHTEIAAES